MADMETLATQLNAFAENKDFEGAFAFVREKQAELGKALRPTGIRDALKKTTDDRTILSFLDSVGFGAAPLDKALGALEKLVGFQPGARVLNGTWGLGLVKRVDYFYKRITVDFKTKKGHQFTYAAAIDMLQRAPENHVLVLAQADPARVEGLLKEHPGEFVKLVLSSYGDMPLARLESTIVSNGFVKAVNWKAFWDKARQELRRDRLVEVPARRTDPLRLRQSAEEYGDNWLTAFAHETDPKLILAAVRAFAAQENRFKAAPEDVKNKIGERLAFAVTAARLVDDALYARLACLATQLGYATPRAEEMREYLWQRKRFIKAAAELPAREVGQMIRFLANDDASKARLYAAIPDLCYAAVDEIVKAFGAEDANLRAAIGTCMRAPAAPATLTTLLAGRYQTYQGWTELPSYATILSHAIALGEGRQSGEALRLQNMVRRLFADTKWLSGVFDMLSPADRVLFFERFQASIAWDPSTHHALVVRMTHVCPELEKHLVKAEKKREYARETSYRSYAFKKAEYLKLINEDMPANVKRIEFAKGFGDLSENAEYQYAKDEQRALMQKQTLMQADLEAVKPSDFASAETSEVMPGVEVVVETPAGDKTYAILGEWDNDIEKNILSMKTQLAQNMLGKKVGDKFELPGAENDRRLASVKEIRPLGAAVREWMRLPAGMQI